jgi:hypothetical protein
MTILVLFLAGMQHFQSLDSAYFYVVANSGFRPNKMKGDAGSAWERKLRRGRRLN